MASPVNVGIELGVNRFNVDEDSPHIILRIDPDRQTLGVLIKACLAGPYKKQNDGSVRSDYVGCLECGTCHILGPDTALEKWEYPRGTFDMEFRYG